MNYLSVASKDKLAGVIIVHGGNLIFKEEFTNYSTGTKINHLN